MSSVRLLVALSVLALGAAAARAQDNNLPVVGTDGHVAIEAGPDTFAPHYPVKPHSLWAWLTYHPETKPGLCGCCKRCAPCCMPPLYTFFLCNGCGGPGPAAVPCPACAGK